MKNLSKHPVLNAIQNCSQFSINKGNFYPFKYMPEIDSYIELIKKNNVFEKTSSVTLVIQNNTFSVSFDQLLASKTTENENEFIFLLVDKEMLITFL